MSLLWLVKISQRFDEKLIIENRGEGPENRKIGVAERGKQLDFRCNKFEEELLLK